MMNLDKFGRTEFLKVENEWRLLKEKKINKRWVSIKIYWKQKTSLFFRWFIRTKYTQK